VTTGAAALAAAHGLRDLRGQRLAVRSLQEYHRSLRGAAQTTEPVPAPEPEPVPSPSPCRDRARTVTEPEPVP
ncbi:MAG: hypothetical protein OXL98_11630, partial [Acidimicrobiaceae bacterium]|nr:hypothetical protein [Acidimicrobiaceae bacterium]